MSEHIVSIKGSSDGLQLSFAPGASFTDIEAEIRSRLESGSGFFLRGTLVFIPPDVLTTEQRTSLQKLFHAHGLICRVEHKPDAKDKPAAKKEQAVKAQVKPAAVQPPVQEMVVVNRTLRGGQEINTKSSVLVCGNVNPGAQIIAGGSIDIRGTCRGFVHAGAYGDTKAFIIADHLMPTQIRIADLIARSPDNMEKKTERAERASIKDGQIVIEPIER